MRKAVRAIDIAQFPDLLSLAKEVQASQEPCLLRLEDQDIAMLTPVKASGKQSRNGKRRVGRTGPDDPLWSIIGIADPYMPPDAPTDVSENKYKYLAEAYDLPENRPQG